MKLTLFTANCTEDPKNTLYPNKAVITSESDMKKAIRTDHVCACFKNSRRSNSNFISADNIALDCDNSHSDNPDDWITPEKLDTILSDVP